MKILKKLWEFIYPLNNNDELPDYQIRNAAYLAEVKNFIPQSLTEEEIIELTDRLISTIKWVDNLIKNHDFERLANHRVLRQSNPIINLEPLYAFDDVTNDASISYNLYLPESYLYVLEEAEKLRKVDGKLNLLNLKDKGRIICFQTGVTTHDGAPMCEGGGFVDDFDIPPIDTWFFLKHEFEVYDTTTLFCWIPKAAEKAMQDAMDVEILDSYAWLDEAYPTVYEEIKKELTTRFSAQDADDL